MKARIQIFLFVFRRFTLVLRLYYSHLKNWALHLRVHELELTQKKDEYGNMVIVSFKQQGTIGILINEYSQGLFGSSGKINIPEKLLDSNELKVTFFSFLRVRTYRFYLDPMRSVYVQKSTTRLRIKTPDWKTSFSTPSFELQLPVSFGHLNDPKIGFSSYPKQARGPVLKELTIKSKINFESLNEQLKVKENE